MEKWLLHVDECEQCRLTPRKPCATGYDLFQRASERLARLYDPNRAKA